jgi:hypothetical protein
LVQLFGKLPGFGPWLCFGFLSEESKLRHPAAFVVSVDPTRDCAAYAYRAVTLLDFAFVERIETSLFV